MAVTREPADRVAYWLQELKRAKQREEKYRKTGKDVLKIYHAEEEQVVPFNILFSNTETLLPALYSAQARPVVQRRHKDDDPIGKLASEASMRLLSYTLDTNREDAETLHEAMESIVLDALTSGRGMAAVKYVAEFRTLADAQPPGEDDEPPNAPSEPPAEEAYDEAVCVESLVWDRIYIGYAKKWTKVPWIAYEFYLTKEEVAALLGDDRKAKTLATKLTYTGEKGDDDRDPEREEQGRRKTACVYQIWDKSGGKQVRYLAPTYPDGFLKEDDDPLQLTGFFNTPRPLTFIKKSSSLTPTAPYQLYKNQAEELNELTRRINRITKACKARALYDSQFGDDLERLMSKEDAVMVPIRTAASLASERGIENAVWFYPLDTVVATLQQLYQAREACKQVIYEITGISDILRGATQASETATAQKIKNSWGTLRLKRGQAEVARYVRDLLRLILELAATKFSEDTWASMTGLPLLAQPTAHALQQQARAVAQTGQPVPQELHARLSMPTWRQILDVLRQDLQRSYRIDIETNSTVEPEAADDQDAIMKMLGALGQAMNGIAPLVAGGSLPFEVAKNILLVVARRFRYGEQIEDAVNAMRPPTPPDHGAEQAKAARQDLELHKTRQESDLRLSTETSRMDLEKRTMQAELHLMKRETAVMEREMKIAAEEQLFAMRQEHERRAVAMDKRQAEQEIGVKQNLQSMQEKRFNVENVVNKKTDTAMGKVEQAVQHVRALAQSIQEMHRQTHEMQAALRHLTAIAGAKRTRTPIRGKDGRIERVEETVEPNT